jgi:uncharacterized alpha-E superfamily protein
MLLSRVADSLYWISRYLERAQHTARLIDARLDLGLDRAPGGDGWNFGGLLTALRADISGHPPTTAAALIDALIFDGGNRSSVFACLTVARENARQVREEISSGMWEQLNALYLRLREARTDGTWSARPHYICQLVIEGVYLIEGVTDATMAHDEGWQYLRFGRFLERAGITATLVDRHFEDGARLPPNHVEWVGLLRSCSALEAYCRRYTADLRPNRIAEFLLLDAEFPRSVRFAAQRIEASLRTIARLTGRQPGGRAERLGGRLHAALDYGQVDEIMNDDLHAYLANINRHCTQIHTAASQTYVHYPIETALPA